MVKIVKFCAEVCVFDYDRRLLSFCRRTAAALFMTVRKGLSAGVCRRLGSRRLCDDPCWWCCCSVAGAVFCSQGWCGGAVKVWVVGEGAAATSEFPLAAM